MRGLKYPVYLSGVMTDKANFFYGKFVNWAS